MSNFVVDVESDGPAPGIYSMISFGIVKLEDLSVRFKGLTRPISDNWVPGALAVSNITREQHEAYPDPRESIRALIEFIEANKGERRPIFWSDNPAYDFQWINYYTIKYHGSNPFGHSGRRIGDVYSGLVMNLRKQSEWKKLRKTRHTHDPLDDALGNAEALQEIIRSFKASSTYQ